MIWKQLAGAMLVALGAAGLMCTALLLYLLPVAYGEAVDMRGLLWIAIAVAGPLSVALLVSGALLVRARPRPSGPVSR